MNIMRLASLYILSLIFGFILQFIPVPPVLATAWPLWTTLLLAAWAMHSSGPPHLIVAMILGIGLDVGFNAVLGEHAVALLFTTFIIMWARPTLESLPWWQTTIALAALWVGNALILTGLDHLTHHEAASAMRWWPVVTETFLWPLISGFIGRLCRPALNTAA